MNIIRHNPLFFKIALSGLLLAGAAVWFIGSSRAEQAAPAPALR